MATEKRKRKALVTRLETFPQIHVPAFVVKTIQQSSPLAAVYNNISVTLQVW